MRIDRTGANLGRAKLEGGRENTLSSRKKKELEGDVGT